MSCGHRVPKVEQHILGKERAQKPWAQTLLLACGHCLDLIKEFNLPEGDFLVKQYRPEYYRKEHNGYCRYYILRVATLTILTFDTLAERVTRNNYFQEAYDALKGVADKSNPAGDQIPELLRTIVIESCKEPILMWLEKLIEYVRGGKRDKDLERALRLDYKAFWSITSDLHRIPWVALEWGRMIQKLNTNTLEQIHSALDNHWHRMVKIVKQELPENYVMRALSWQVLSLELVASAGTSPDVLEWETLDSQLDRGYIQSMHDKCRNRFREVILEENAYMTDISKRRRAIIEGSDSKLQTDDTEKYTSANPQLESPRMTVHSDLQGRSKYNDKTVVYTQPSTGYMVKKGQLPRPADIHDRVGHQFASASGASSKLAHPTTLHDRSGLLASRSFRHQCSSEKYSDSGLSRSRSMNRPLRFVSTQQVQSGEFLTPKDGIVQVR